MSNSNNKIWLEELNKLQFFAPQITPVTTGGTAKQLLDSLAAIPAPYAYALCTLFFTHQYNCVTCKARKRGSENMSRTLSLEFFEKFVATALKLPDTFKPSLVYRFGQVRAEQCGQI